MIKAYLGVGTLANRFVNLMNDEECLQAITNGGKPAQRAIGLLYERYAKRFTAYLTRRHFSQDDAEDMVQDVFVNIASKLQGSSYQIENGRAYLYRALHNRLVDFLRSKKPVISESSFATDDESSQPFFETVAGDLGISEEDTGFLLCFQGALHRFYDENAEAGTAVDLAAVEGFSGEELAEALGRTYAATRQFLSQAKKKFRTVLMELCMDYVPESARAT